jgi:hypothetical protein
MSSIREELDSFNQFAAERLAAGDAAASLDELFVEWLDRHARAEIDAAIRRGLADIDAGRHKPADEVNESIRQEFGFADE